jgi:hypothetical protein
VHLRANILPSSAIVRQRLSAEGHKKLRRWTTEPIRAIGKAEVSYPILDRIAKRERRRQRQQPPGDDKEDSRHQGHLDAGNGDDV